jgi:hypothetical protein
MRINGIIVRFDRRGSHGVLFAAALVVAGCTHGGGDAASLQPGGESGYRWVGQGEKQDFAASYSFCRENQQLQQFGSLSPGGQSTGAGSSTYNLPDTNFVSAPQRGGYATRRSFDSCMRSQGWAIAEPATQPIQPQQPLPPASAPGPTPSTP